jgi:hypothetical protein
MIDAADSMLVHCGWCRHEWFALKLPMPIAEAAEKMIAMRCPECDKALIYCGPAPLNTSAEHVKETGES